MKSFLILVAVFFSINTFCQVSGTDSLPDSPTIKTEIDSTFSEVVPTETGTTIKFTSRKEFWFGISVLISLIIILPLLIWIIQKKNMNDELSVRLLLTSVVIISTLFIVVAGYDDKSIAPAFGLFGAILGYVFGKSQDKNS